MQARLLAFVIWAAVAATAVFWLLRLWSSSPAAPPYTVAPPATTTARPDLTTVFGAPAAAALAAAPVEPALASRFKLLGVAAPRESGDSSGLALIAVDGKPARGFKVGSAIDGDLVLQSVHPRGAAVGAKGAPASLSLELPALAGAISSPRAGTSGGATPTPANTPGLTVPGTGAIVSVPTSIVPPPSAAVPLPGMRPPESGEAAEPQPVAPPPGPVTNTR